MTSTSSTPVARLSSPGAIVATIPSLCGFEPQESVVVLSLRGERKRVGLTARLDLPGPESEVATAAMFAERMAHDGAVGAVVAVFSTDRRVSLVDALSEALEDCGIEVMEALHVDRGRWWSYTCQRSCCPAEGTAVPATPGLVAAQRTLDGRAVLASREQLVASLAAPTFLAAEESAQLLEDATVAWVQQWSQDPKSACAAAVREARRLLEAVAQGRSVAQPEAAALTVSLHDVRVRDEVATWSLKRSDALLSLLEQVVRLVVPPYDAPVCTLLAWVAYARGDGSRVNVALERALGTDPAYSLALLLRAALDGGLAPRQVRRILMSTKRALREVSSPD
jgi:hypothetical protein